MLRVLCVCDLPSPLARWRNDLQVCPMLATGHGLPSGPDWLQIKLNTIGNYNIIKNNNNRLAQFIPARC